MFLVNQWLQDGSQNAVGNQAITSLAVTLNQRKFHDFSLKLKMIKLPSINRTSLVYVSFCSNTG